VAEDWSEPGMSTQASLMPSVVRLARLTLGAMFDS
jgi:hypothetical protein